ncbi:LytTR family transcriptional regulator, partial [Camelimonas abortus]
GVAVAGTAGPPAPLALETAAAASRRLGALAPQGHLGGRDGWRAPLADFLRAHPDAGVAWIADALDVKGAPGAAAFGAALAAMAGGRLQVYGDHPAPGFAIAGVSNEPEGLDARVLRTGGAGPVRGVARARDARGLPLGEGAFAFGPGDETATARISLPVEVRNRAARLEIAGQSSAMAVALLDASHRRRRVGLVTGVSVDQAQPLLSPTWYVDRALASAAEIREPRMGASEAVNALIDERAAVIVLADVGALEPAVRERLARWVKAGGVLVRFAGPRLAAAGAETAAPVRDDDLLPVRLRGDGRSLGGALSWETPKTLAPFAADGPFAGLRAPGEITVRRQLLAEPDGDLAGRTWAALSDGTPVVTARRDGAGLLVLFHVTADPSWSSLPMSGLFVQMLQRIVAMAPDAAPVIDGRDVAAPQTRPAPAAAAPSPARLLAPRRTLDGFGQWREPPAEARGVPANYAGRASLAHPAGLYGPAAETLAVNVLTGADSIAPADLSALKPLPLQEAGARDLRGPLLLAALALFLVDCLVMLLSAGGVGWPQRRRRGAAAAAA